MGGNTLLHMATLEPERIEAMVVVSATMYFPEEARAIMRQIPAAREQTPRIKASTLIVYGDRDPLYPVEMAVAKHRAIPRSALWVVPNSGHGPVFFDAAIQFAQTALVFLRTSA